MTRAARWLWALSAVLLLGVAVAGCKKEKKSSPNYWVKRLSGSKWQEALRSLERMANTPGPLGEKARAAMLQPLIKLFDRNSEPAVLTALVNLKDKAAVPVLEKALAAFSETSGQSLDNALIAANALKVWGGAGAPGAEAKLITLATNKTPLQTPNVGRVRHATINEVRMAVIDALGSYPSAASTDALALLLADSPDNVNVLLQGAACRAISVHPDAARALPQVMRGLFLWHKDISQTGSYPQCRLAIARIGAAAEGPLSELVQEKYKTISEMAIKEKWKADESGVMVTKGAELLGDIRATKATAALRAQLAKESAADVDTVRTAAYAELLRSLAVIGDKEGSAELLKLALGAKLEGFRGHAANFYSLSGGREGKAALLAVAADASKFEQWRIAATIALGRISSSADDLKALEGLQAKLKADDPVKEVATEAISRAKVGAECAGKPDCFAGKLGDSNPAVVEKALLELGWAGEAAASVTDKVIAAVGAESSAVRTVARIALSRVRPGKCPECIKGLEEIIKKQEGSSARRDDPNETPVLLNWYLGKEAPASAGGAPAVPAPPAGGGGAPPPALGDEPPPPPSQP